MGGRLVIWLILVSFQLSFEKHKLFGHFSIREWTLLPESDYQKW